MLVEQNDGWRWHVGADSPAERRRLLRLMWRRSWWAARHHGWRDALGKAAAGAFVFALAVTAAAQWPPRPLPVVATSLALAVLVAAVAYPIARVATVLVWWWRLAGRGGWIVHWCEGPNAALAVRLTLPRPASSRTGARQQWRGMDLFGQGGAGHRLVGWLRSAAEHDGAVLIIRTTQPPLEPWYQAAGMTLAERPRLRLGHMQIGVSTFCHPADGWSPPATRIRRLRYRRIR